VYKFATSYQSPAAATVAHLSWLEQPDAGRYSDRENADSAKQDVFDADGEHTKPLIASFAMGLDNFSTATAY